MTAAADRAEHAPDRTFRRWALGITLCSLVVFAWMVTLGRWDFLATGIFSDVFDLQARAIADGTLVMPDGSLAFEGFIIDGKTYAYFGIFPSLLRLPIFAVTDSLDGRLTALSLLAAYAIALWAAARVIEGVHALARPDQAWTRAGRILALVAFAALALGSNLMFLASGAWVYHEASLWGVASVFAAFAAVLRYLRTPSWRPLLSAGAWTLVAWWSRGSVGLAPSAVLGLLAVATCWHPRPLRALVPSVGPGAGNRRLAAGLLTAAVVGGVAFGVINTLKFGSPTVLPMDKQVASQNPWPSRKAALEAYDGSLFSVRLIPAVVAQTLRPDVLGPSGTWPFLEFNATPPLELGQPVFDTVEPTMGLTLTHPALLALAAVGAVAVFSRRPTRTAADAEAPGLAALRPFVFGSLAAASMILGFAFIAQRYLTDLLPLVLVLAAAGLAATDRWVATGARTPRVRAVLVAAAVLAAAGTAVTLAGTWTYQRFHIPPDAAARAAGLRAQVSVARFVGSPPDVERGTVLPERATGGTLFILGECDGLYRGQDDGVWVGIEVREGGGRHHLRVQPTAALANGPALVAAVSGSGGDTRFVLHRLADGRLRLDLERPDRTVEGTPFTATETLDVLLDLEPTLPTTGARVNGTSVLFEVRPAPTGPLTLGTDRAAAVDRVPIPAPTCEALLGS